MSIDGILVLKLVNELKEKLINGRIDTIDGINKTDYSFKVRVPGVTYSLFISISYNNPTIFITKEKFEKPLVASSFTMYLRKHLEGGYIRDIYQYNNDRVVMIDIETSNEFDGVSKKTIVIELIGRFSNLLILDNDKKILEAIKQLSVLENNSRGVMKGLKYEPLKNDKLSPFDKDGINNIFNNNYNLDEATLINNISGMSKPLASYLINEYKNSKDDFYTFFSNEINKYDQDIKNTDYYYFNIFNKEMEHMPSISGVLYKYYLDNALLKTLKDNNADVYRCIQSNLKRVTKKLGKLEDELEKDKNADDLRLKGELLLSIAYRTDIERTSIIKVLNYYTNEYIDIDIDPAKSLKDNSQLYYKKYKKSKLAIEHILREMNIAKSEIEYFELLKYQLSNTTLKDLLEIKDELISNGYILEKDNKKKIKNKKPNFLKIEYSGCNIYVGKNNIQNDYITHVIGRKDDLWFHVKNDHGSHVVVSGNNKYNEDVIRYAANLAAKYSDSKDSSSVPVDYTEIKNLKKVPGKKGSFVTFKKNKTIYIDPKRE